ncbi:ABC transporter permease [Dinghuibacter silviterrae]|uniref:ABC-2 type transport system permease protein n=1 Tax=Dinghuibacter silviterrae TaxID=1539049 RepID=A0A4R8DHV5_9BACT|nr:ABC transporter permease [Dinghuibacter silviterrae]TDW96844.1 ABC-2 type transport system permease protein [Dinghuibacter silviterrae]
MTPIPSTSTVLRTLLRADMLTQWRNRRAFLLSLLVPVVILISWKSLVDKMGAAYALSTSITIGVAASCLIGYSNAIARDRDKGVFQRLRVAPVPAWTVMGSRLIVQLITILITTIAVYLVGFYVDHIQITLQGYLLGLVAALTAALVYLCLGQMIVGLIKNPETVNSTTRLVYLVFIMVGLFGEMGALGNDMKVVTQWSPYGTVKRVLGASMQPGAWNTGVTQAILVAVGYALVFAAVGIKKFRWDSR